MLVGLDTGFTGRGRATGVVTMPTFYHLTDEFGERCSGSAVVDYLVAYIGQWEDGRVCFKPEWPDLQRNLMITSAVSGRRRATDRWES